MISSGAAWELSPWWEATPTSQRFSEERHRVEGWSLTPLFFLPGVDDAESECGLDNFGNFDWVIENHGDEQCLEDQLEHLLGFIQAKL